jgi:serine/threonine protein kinase
MASPCPTSEALKRFLLGQLSAGEHERLALHVSQCGQCIRTLGSLPAGDDLLGARQTPPPKASLPRQVPVDEPPDGAGEPSPDQPLFPDAVEGQLMEDLSRSDSPPSPTLRTSFPNVAWPSLPSADEEGWRGPTPARGPHEPGQLGPYRLLKVLGRGGMGIVYLAEDTVLNRQVALKAMSPARAESQEARQRFLREARAAAALEHDHIVAIYQVGEDRGSPYLAMPLLKGESLEQRLQRCGPLATDEAIRIGREVALGLAAAHARGLVHRDIKPANLWLEADHHDRVKLLDFGLVCTAEDNAPLTRKGVLLGTPAYMAPEQARGEKVDARSDLFSLGCVLYDLLTGTPPFQASNVLGVLTALATATPKPLGELVPDVPPALADLIGQLLAKDPKDRPASAEAVLAALDRIESRPTGAPVSLGPAAPSWLWRLALLSAALLVGLGNWFFGGSIAGFLTDKGGAGTRTVPPARPLTIRLRVDRLSPQGFNFRPDELGETVYRVRFKEKVEPRAELSEPAYAYLLAFNPAERKEDQEQLVPEEAAQQRPERVKVLHPGKWLTLNDGEGLQAFAVVASRRPLPSYAEWLQARSASPWQRTRAKSDVVLRSDGRGPVEEVFGEGVQRATQEPAGDRTAIERLAGWLREQQEVEAVAVLGFAVDGE